MNAHRWIALALFVPSLFAQTPTAGLVGTVLDHSGAAVPGASLEVRNIDTNDTRKVSAGEHGEFTVPDLLPGSYEVTITKEGFARRRETGITLEVDQVARMDFRLEVGAVSQTIEVQATAAPIINTENGSKGEVMTADQIVEMPLNGRAVTDLGFLVPNVVPNAQGAQGGVYAVNGQRSDNTNFVLDGFNNQDPQTGTGPTISPNIDALQEFRMETSNYSAESGRLSGGVMKMVLKTGGNQLHGSLFEFLRNDAFDVRNFFDQAKSKLRQNQFGGTLSGPVRIPRIYNGRDRTFFLFSWESFRQTQGSSKVGVVPTAAQRDGDFSASGALKDPLGGTFSGGEIPLSRMSPIALKAQALYPLPNLAGVNNYLSYATAPNDWNRYILKFDERFSDRDTVSLRFTKQYSSVINEFGGSPNLALWPQRNSGTVFLAGLTYTHLFSPTLINEARFGVTRYVTGIYPLDQQQNLARAFGLPYNSDPVLGGTPSFVISGLDTLGDATNIPQAEHNQNTQLGDTMTRVTRQHLLKFGGEFLHTAFNFPVWNNINGTYNFTGSWTNQPYADFLLGELNSDSRLTGTLVNYYRTSAYGFFVQDDWKIASRFTLNLGLRYEIPKNPVEKYGRTANFVPSQDKLLIGSEKSFAETGATFSNPNLVEFADQLGLPQYSANNYNDLAPRVGFAWRPFGGNRTSVRGGYGIFYGSEQENPLRNQLGNVFPYVNNQTISRIAAQPSYLTLASPFPVAANLVGNLSTLAIAGFQLNSPTPYGQSWNLTVERDLGFATALEVSYVGSKGTHLPLFFNINQGFWPVQPGPNVPYPGWGTINYFNFEINSTYNAGTVTLRRRLNKGFFFTSSFVFSKSIDEGSELSGGSTGGVNGLQNPRCFRCDRGRSDFDIPRAFTMNFSWLSPGHSLLLRGWQMAGSGRAYSGPPFTLSLTNININSGEPSRPNRIGKGTVPNPSVNEWYDVADFPVVPAGSYKFGNAGRDILDGPGHIEANLALSRNFKLRETDNLQFRWEVFNASNHPNFNLPVTAVNAPNAATITSAGSGRLMQFGLRYSF